MQRSRKESLSVYYYIRDLALKDYFEFQEKDELQLVDDVLYNTMYKTYKIITTNTPYPFERGRGLLYFDTLDFSCLVTVDNNYDTPEQSNRIVIYDKYLNIIEDSLYIVDYVTGHIIMLENIVPKYIDYYWYYISIVDGWSAVSSSTAPVIVIDINNLTKSGFQLGGGKKITRKSSIYLFASSSSERSDLVEILYDSLYLKTCPLYDFPHGSALDYDGTFYNRKNNLNKETNMFSRTVVSGTSNLRFENVEARNINLPLTLSINNEASTLSDLNAYRAKITFDLVSYT